MKGSEIAKVVGGEFLGEDLDVKNFVFDSRECCSGSLFVPLKGRRDGHGFIEDAFKRGAVGTFSETPLSIKKGFQILVDDTLKAFERFALYKRKHFEGKVIALTGSVGKTTTKELLFFTLSKFFAVHCSKKSYNNLIGVSYTLSNLDDLSDIYLQEIGTNSRGEVGFLREIVCPHLSVVTAIGKSHTQSFKRMEDLVEEKFSITEGVEFAVVPSEFSAFSKAKETFTFGREGDVSVKSVSFDFSGTRFVLSVEGRELRFFSKIPGYSIVNATMIAVLVAKLLNIPFDCLVEAVGSFTSPEKRMNLIKLKDIIVIDDSYNANPTSMENALRVLSTFKGRKVAVLGDMLELDNSPSEHRRIGEILNSLKVDLLVAFGEMGRYILETYKGEAYHFTDREKFLEFLKVCDFSGSAVLVKGSRSNRLEDAVNILVERFRN